MERAVQGSNPGEDESFSVRTDRPCGPATLLCDGYGVSWPREKRPERGVEHPLASGAEVKERVGLYLMAGCRVSFTFTFYTVDFTAVKLWVAHYRYQQLWSFTEESKKSCIMTVIIYLIPTVRTEEAGFKPPPRNSEGPPKSCQTQPDCENC